MHLQLKRARLDPWVGRGPGEGLAAHSSLIAGEFYGQRSLVRYSQWGHSQTRLSGQQAESSLSFPFTATWKEWSLSAGLSHSRARGPDLQSHCPAAKYRSSDCDRLTDDFANPLLESAFLGKMKHVPEGFAAFNLKTAKETQSFQREEMSRLRSLCISVNLTVLLKEAAPPATMLPPPPHPSRVWVSPLQACGTALRHVSGDLESKCWFNKSCLFKHCLPPASPNWCSVNPLTIYLGGLIFTSRVTVRRAGRVASERRFEGENAKAECGAGRLRCILC